jgi:hypothetical protein
MPRVALYYLHHRLRDGVAETAGGFVDYVSVFFVVSKQQRVCDATQIFV